MTVSLTGIDRARANNIELNDNNIPMAEITLLSSVDVVDLKVVVELIKALKTELKEVPENVDAFLNEPAMVDLATIIDTLILEVPQLTLDQKIDLIIESDPIKRLEILMHGFRNNDKQRQDREVDTEISRKIKDRMDQQQREYYLREKMRTIKEELGEGEGSDFDAVRKYRERLETEPFPKNVKEKILASINKLDAMQGASAEANVERNYVD